MVELMLTLWVADPLVKLFPDALPPAEGAAVLALQCARNEYEPAQFGIRCNVPLEGLTVQVSPLIHEDGTFTLPAENVRWNFVGFIPLQKNTPAPAAALVRQAPCEVPDVLRAERTMDLAADRTQPVWLTVFVPEEAPAGLYRGEVTVTAGPVSRSLPVELTVWPFTVPAERHLYVTNWFGTSQIARAHRVEEWSEEFWPVLAAYFRNMAAHRQNVAWVPWRLIRVWREADGTLSYDYSRFDRYVELMHACGVADRIEIQFTAHFGEGGWSSPEIQLNSLSATDRASGQTVTLDYQEGLKPFLGALERHLEERGWLEKAMIHICDEPALHNSSSWREQSRRVHEAAPRIKRIDAIEGTDFFGELEVWVPKLSHLRNWFETYKRAQSEGAELWYYICCHPTGGHYPNRFLDYPLTQVRLLHWLNFAYGLDGYLHWGLNWWGEDAFGVPSADLPPGDTHVIYPGPEGPLDSVRWEVQRDSLEDFEYLWLLTEKLKAVQARLGPAARDFDPAQRGREFCRRLFESFTDTTRDPALLQATRRELAAEIVAAEQTPLLLVWTRPPAESELVPGPIVVEVCGATEPGATVQINGGDVPVDAQGRFAREAFLPENQPTATVTVTATRDGQTHTVTRRFPVRVSPAAG